GDDLGGVVDGEVVEVGVEAAAGEGAVLEAGDELAQLGRPGGRARRGVLDEVEGIVQAGADERQLEVEGIGAEGAGGPVDQLLQAGDQGVEVQEAVSDQSVEVGGVDAEAGEGQLGFRERVEDVRRGVLVAAGDGAGVVRQVADEVEVAEVRQQAADVDAGVAA